MNSNISNELSEVFNTEVYDNPLIKNEKLLTQGDDLDDNGDDNSPDAR